MSHMIFLLVLPAREPARSRDVGIVKHLVEDQGPDTDHFIPGLQARLDERRDRLSLARRSPARADNAANARAA